MLDDVYSKALKTYKGDKSKASAVAWSAAKGSGWFKKGDQWKKKGESEQSHYHWLDFWKRIQYRTPDQSLQAQERNIVEALGEMGDNDYVWYKARILAAVPGKSLNGRVYPRETLQQMTPLYEGKPFILDHDIEHAERIVGVITRPRYGVEEGWDGKNHEGTWLDAYGHMPRFMFDKFTGKGQAPPMVRGVSIGGQGDGQYNADGGTLIRNFQPAELSVTGFPGIPDAQVANISLITESYRKQGLLAPHRYQKMNMSFDEAKKQAKRSIEKSSRIQIREIGSGPGQTNTPVVGSSPRPALRGLNAEVDSVPRKDVTHTVPQTTYGSDTVKQVDPYDTPSGSAPFQSVGANPYAHLKGQSSTEGSATGAGYGAKSSRDAKSWSPKIPQLGRTTTQSPGFGGMSPSGTGIVDQDEAANNARVRATVDSLQHDLDMVLQGMRTGKMPQEAKIDVSKPEEEEEEGEEAKKGEEEEEEEEERVLMRHLVRLEAKKLQREMDFDLGDQRSPNNPASGDTSVNDYQRTRNPGVNVTNSPPNEGGGQGEGITHVSSGRSPSAREQYQPTREEEDFAKTNPLKSEEDEEEEEEARVIRNRIIRLRMARMFPEATGQSMPKTSTSITKNIPSLGHTTTKTGGFGKQSPSGTGLKDQPEEEEETVTINGVVYRREQQPPSDVDKDQKPSGEEEEEETITVNGVKYHREDMPMTPNLSPSDGRDVLGNPLMRVQRDPDGDGDRDNVGANPVTAGGEENVPQDLYPIEGRAPSLALGMGQTLWHNYIRGRREPSREQMQNMIENFNRLKQEKPEQYRKVYVRTQESRNSVNPIGTGAGTAIPTLPGVPGRGMMTSNPTLSQPYQTVSQDMRGFKELAKVRLAEIEKLPMSARKSTNMGKSLWDAMLPEIMEVH